MTGILQGKTLIVTGAGGGIGRAASMVLAAAGANVVVSDIVEGTGQATVDAVRAGGGTALFVKADLASEADVRALVERAVSAYGRLDGAFNNAGLEQCALPLHELTTDQRERALKVDLTSVFWCLKYQVLAMLSSGGGAIVNTASSLGQVAIPNASEYIAAKHGVVGLTRAAAAEYGARGIRVNAVLPGIVLTPMISRLVEDPQFSAFFQKVKERHPIGRFGQPAEIGEAVKWLLSDLLEQWDRALRIDLTSVFLCIKHEVTAMLTTGGGAIVNTASSLGQVAIPNASEYISAKHGVVGLTRAAAAEYGRQGIRVNAVLPGIVLTPMISRLVEDPRFSAFFQKVKERHPIGRFGQPAEIGEAVKWLLSDLASFVNGAAFAVDGGYLAI